LPAIEKSLIIPIKAIKHEIEIMITLFRKIKLLMWQNFIQIYPDKIIQIPFILKCFIYLVKEYLWLLNSSGRVFILIQVMDAVLSRLLQSRPLSYHNKKISCTLQRCFATRALQ
jgi:hypothetical protein